LSEVICPFSGSINSVPPLKSFGVPNEWLGARAMRMVSAPQSPLGDYDCASGSNRHRRREALVHIAHWVFWLPLISGQAAASEYTYLWWGYRTWMGHE